MSMKNLPDIWQREMGSPLRDISRLQRSIDRVFNDIMGPYESMVVSDEAVGYSPLCNVEETDTHFLVSFDLPGLSKDDIKVEIKDNQLCVSGERKQETRSEKTARHSVERFYGSFRRVFALPGYVNPTDVEANYRDGVLRVALLKKEDAKPKLIEITEGKNERFERRLEVDREPKTTKAA